MSASPRDRLIRFHTTLLHMTPRTWAIPTIVGANVFVFVAMLVAGAGLLGPGINMMVQWGANCGPLTMNGQWWRLLTCMFLHFGLLHIGFNMYVLWQIGHFVERLVGNTGLLLLYVTSGIAASIASLAWNPAQVSAGASGAVFGVCGALLGFIVLRRDTIPLEVIKSLRSSMVTFLVYNAVFALMLPFIDWAAHAGGFVYGVFCGAMLSQPVISESTRTRWIRNGILTAISAVVLPGAVLLLPPLPSDVMTSLDEILRVDAITRSQTVALIDQWQNNAVTDEQIVDSLKNDMLPKWQQTIDEIDAFGKQTVIKPEILARLRSYLVKRLESVQLLVDGIRTGNPQKLGQANKAWNDADALVEHLFSDTSP